MIVTGSGFGTVRSSFQENHALNPLVPFINICTADKVDGAPFAEYIKEGPLGRFLGFLACLIQASFTIAGPEYVSMTAGEVSREHNPTPSPSLSH